MGYRQKIRADCGTRIETFRQTVERLTLIPGHPKALGKPTRPADDRPLIGGLKLEAPAIGWPWTLLKRWL